MATVTNLAAKASPSPDFAKASTADSASGFVAMVAGAAKPVAHTMMPSRPARAGDKADHTRRDDDSVPDRDDTPAVADGSTLAPMPLLTIAAVAQGDASAKPGKTASGAQPRAASGSATVSAPVNEAAIDLTQTDIAAVDPTLAPVLAALADSLAAQPASDKPTVAASADPASVADATAAPAAAPTTATATLMASRVTPAGIPFSGRADARVPASNGRKSDDDADPDVSAATIDPTVSAPPIPVATTVGATTGVHASIADGAAGQLATGAADRQLDLAKQGAWLDGIAHDIAATGAGTDSVRFVVAPQHLGSVQVEMARGGDGATVTLTASSEASRVALADARPQLIAEAGRHGIHIASAQVEVGSGQTGSSDPRSSGQGDSRSSANSSSGDGSFSAQANAQGDPGRQSQTRSQPSAANPVPTTGSPDAELAPEPTDGLYA